MNSVLGYSNRRMGGSGGGGSIGGYSRPGPYDRGDRYGGGGGGSGRFHSRGSRSFKGGYSNNMPGNCLCYLTTYIRYDCLRSFGRL